MKVIFCKFFGKMEEGYDNQFYPGKIGKKIYKNISKKAWEEWRKQQTKIINEKKLNMSHTDDYKKLEKEMIHFLFKNNIQDLNT